MLTLVGAVVVLAAVTVFDEEDAAETEVRTSLAAAVEPLPVEHGASPEDPDGSGDYDRWVVSLGDSYISGEGGRWAGNQSYGSGAIDALGETAYYDNADGSGETIPMCHRSKSALIHIGGDVGTLNLACSGATTASSYSGGAWKPGIDFANNGGGQIGQARMLQEFAEDHDVEMVVLSIGGIDFHFADIVKACVLNYVLGAGDPDDVLCSENASVLEYLSEESVAEVRSNIAASIANIHTAMTNAGTADDEWSLVVNLYPSVLPDPSNMRYMSSNGQRWLLGGCGISDPDLAWANGTVLETVNDTVKGAVIDASAATPGLQVTVMDTTEITTGRELCADTVGRVGPMSTPSSWTAKEAADQSEWLTEIEIHPLFSHVQQESLHPNYWGQLALRNCLRDVFNSGDVSGGTCVPDEGVNAHGEPNVNLE